ncbi:MAG: DUF5683 domain-containing protein [Tannerella sp.]|jgi:hypothetical protein|nr:DUF5683 domain-containing protein [Tannerella sp.]
MCKGRFLKHACIVISAVCFFLSSITGIIYAQDTIPRINSTFFLNDSIVTTHDYDITGNDSTFFHEDDSSSVILSDSAITAIIKENEQDIALKDATSFKPNPKTAYIMAAIFPGFGQAYNRQYWKLPIVYGGFVGFIYAITWNNKNLQDYSRAYFDIRRDYDNYIKNPAGSDPESWSQSWKDFIGANRDPASYLTNTNFHNQLKSGKDFYRRYRDLSIILSVAFYFICIADSYVDAQMFEFDISPDLSFHVMPEICPSTICNPRSFGLNICMTF